MVVLCFGVCILLPSVAMVTGCDLLVVAGNAVVLLWAMVDISCRVMFSLFIDSSFVVVFTFSVILFVCVD